MHFIDTSFPTPEQNLAADEFLLDQEQEVLRFWEPNSYFVVLGHSNKIKAEVKSTEIPVFRRVSGGGCVLQGPGCLNYALVLDSSRPGLEKIDSTNRAIMEKNRNALLLLLPDVQIQGVSDLTLHNLKFSGNAQRRKHRFILFHGTFLLTMDLTMVEKVLNMPEKQPDYRKNRPHGGFIANVPVESAAIKDCLKTEWQASGPDVPLPATALDVLAQKHTDPNWINKF